MQDERAAVYDHAPLCAVGGASGAAGGDREVLDYADDLGRGPESWTVPVPLRISSTIPRLGATETVLAVTVAPSLLPLVPAWALACRPATTPAVMTAGPARR